MPVRLTISLVSSQSLKHLGILVFEVLVKAGLDQLRLHQYNEQSEAVST